MHRRRFALGAGAAIVLFATLIVAATSTATLIPTAATFTLRPGGHATESKSANIPALIPSSADVEIAFDTTGSMQPTIDQAKAQAIAIVNGVKAVVPDTQFAVTQFKDFCTTTAPTSGPGCTNPGGAVSPGDYPDYAVAQPMTSDATAVQAALNTFTASGGGLTSAEDYNLMFNNSYADATNAIGWRTGSRKFVIVFGDAEPHGAGTDGVPGCADTTVDPHNLHAPTELAGMNSNQRTLFMILQQFSTTTSASLACYQGLAAGAFTGSAGVVGAANLADQIVALIQNALSMVGNVHLTVLSATPAPANASWITLPAALGPVATPVDGLPLGNVDINVPPGTAAGTYHFVLRAMADGVPIGDQDLTIVVPQKMITLTPPTATNPVGTSHTVTANVFDTLGPYVGDTVTFAVSGGPAAVPSTGTATTDANGNATFTFSNTPPAAGTNTITATDDPAAPATATKTWVAPNATIQISPLTASNPLGTMHTLTGHVNVDSGNGLANAPDGTVISFSVVSGPGNFVGSTSCTTSGGTGSCTATITSATPGTTVVRAATDVTVLGVALHRATNDGLPGDSPDAQKTWLTPGANIQISPLTATNNTGTNHTLTGHVNVSPVGAGFVNAPDGTVISFSIVSGPGSFVGPTSCTTSGGTGSCNAVITSASAGTTVVRAATDVTVSGIALHRQTNDGLPGNSPDAQKIWVAPPPPPNCNLVSATPLLWPPNHRLQTVTLSTPQGGVSIVITGVTQDEPVNGTGDGDTSPDAFLTSPPSNSALLRVERAGPGDGRVYHLIFTATTTGGSCTGNAVTSVVHDQSGRPAIDSAPPSYNSLLP
jgi:hypothetical protein